MYLLRLDDASEHMNIEKWERMEVLLDKYGIKPIFGIIPNNKDLELIGHSRVNNFWMLAHKWIDKGWIPAMHGCTHVFETMEGGINPVNKKSEFAGLPLEIQRGKIKSGYKIMIDHGIKPDIFFAPAHTFDFNTLEALYIETDIRIISDTIAWDIYYKKPFYFIPQQSGRVRRLPFKTTTFCYHPNTMDDRDYKELECFIISNQFGKLEPSALSESNKSILDGVLQFLYFTRKRLSL